MFKFFISDDTAFLFHMYLLAGDVLATISVGVGILWETEALSVRHKVAGKLILWGVVAETLCSLTLFILDEGISGAQQTIIAAQQDRIILLQDKLAFRTLTRDQQSTIATAVMKFKDVAFDASVSEDADSRQLLGHILPALTAAGWQRLPWGGPGVGLAAYLDGKAIAFLPNDGVVVEYHPDDRATLASAAQQLADALTAQHIPAKAVMTDTIRAGQLRLMVGAKTYAE